MVWPDTVTFDIELTDDYSNYEISNDKLIKESVKFDERMCTGDRLKFGLCEGSVIEFQYFDFQNIRGKRIFVKVEVEIKGWVDVFDYIWYPEYIIIEDGDYKIVVKDAVGTVTITHDGTSVTKNFSSDTTIPLSDYRVGDKLEFSATISGQGYIKVFEDKSTWEEIPIGWFDVEECPRQASTGIYKATAINKLKSDYLNNKANSIVEELYSDPTIPVTIYDIKKALLNQYTIIEKPPAFTPYNPGYIQYGKDSVTIPDLGFAKDYGVKSPLNTRMYCEYANDGPYIYYQQSRIELTLNCFPRTYNFINHKNSHLDFSILHNTLDELQKNIEDYLIKFFDEAQLCIYYDLHRVALTGKEILERFMVNKGSNGYLGGQFYVEAGIGLSSESDKYSDTQYKWEKEKGMPISVKGTLKDFFFRIYEPSQSGTRVDVYFPRLISVYYVDSYGDRHYAPPIYLEYNYNYRYYETYDDYIVDQNPVDANNPPLLNSDGSSYSLSDILNVYELDSFVFPTELTKITLADAVDFTLRDITSSSFELQCQYGKLDRETDLFSGVELNNSRLLPADTLYPANDLYPNGMSEHPMKSQYSKLWTDSAGVQKFRYLIITYKTLEGEQGQEQEVEKTLQRTVNNDGNVDYNMSDNWLFRNLVWTAQDVGAYADAMVLKMKDVTWFPFEMWCAGLPYLEAGDEIEITTDDGTYTSYVLNRQLNGIHNLEDNLINGTLDIF